jgi:hypothetical protein
MEWESPVIHIQNEKRPIKTKRTKRTKKPKVTRKFDSTMESVTEGPAVMQVGAYWWLRNALVADRIDTRVRRTSIYLSQSDQYAAIREYVRHDTAPSKVHSQVRQNVAALMNDGYERIFDAFKEGFLRLRTAQKKMSRQIEARELRWHSPYSQMVDSSRPKDIYEARSYTSSRHPLPLQACSSGDNQRKRHAALRGI